jgi:cytochrome b
VVRVWSLGLRALHWSLAATVIAAWVTREGFGVWHERVGDACLALVGVRLLMGFMSGTRARFAHFVRDPGATWAYARQAWARREPRYLGHNPLGAWMILALLFTAAMTGVTGWVYTTDRFWGDPLVEQLHEICATALVGLAAAHVLGVIATSIRHRENLARAMVTGDKRCASGDDID